eukprot:6059971-Amphidinium_carterae.1
MTDVATFIAKGNLLATSSHAGYNSPTMDICGAVHVCTSSSSSDDDDDDDDAVIQTVSMNLYCLVN